MSSIRSEKHYTTTIYLQKLHNQDERFLYHIREQDENTICLQYLTWCAEINSEVIINIISGNESPEGDVYACGWVCDQLKNSVLYKFLK